MNDSMITIQNVNKKEVQQYISKIKWRTNLKIYFKLKNTFG